MDGARVLYVEDKPTTARRSSFWRHKPSIGTICMHDECAALAPFRVCLERRNFVGINSISQKKYRNRNFFPCSKQALILGPN